jgi:hypothetical protein
MALPFQKQGGSRTPKSWRKPPEPAPQAEKRAPLRERLASIVGRLESMAIDRVGKRQPMERRWIEDLEQYWGIYDNETRQALAEGDKSKLFINMTRPKTDAMSARLMDLLFPTDDKNWGINPTPVPELTENASKAAKEARQKAEQAAAMEQDPEANPQALAAVQEEAAGADALAKELQSRLDEANKRAELMAHEIDDQLKESLYHAAMRDVIENACKIGTGVAKGPVTGDRVRKGWKPQAEGGYALAMSEGNQPSMRHVDIWGFFPDMEVSRIEDGEGVFERHLMNAKKLRGLSRLKGFDKDAIRSLLREKPKGGAPSYLADLRNIVGDLTHVANDVYHVWEYSGPLSADDMRDLAELFGDEKTAQELAEIDPLEELNAIVWFCQGELLKFAIYPYDSGECMYSVFNLVKDESSVFGYGVPSMVRDPQRALNASWRAMMDNAGLSTGPQIVIDRSQVTPADGKWTITPRKLWFASGSLPNNKRAFDAFNVPSAQGELANIILMARNFIDEMSSMPQIAQGEQGTGVTKTAQGMALLMNSANVVFRRIVKNFDDDMTTPNIRRFYDWNMQFNPKEEIKGDYEVDARGSSVLLVRELQSQNLMFIAMNLGAHPIFGPMLKNRAVLRKLFQSMMIPAADVVLSDDEIDAVLAKAAALQKAEAEAAMQAAGSSGEDPDIKVQIANMDSATKRYVVDRQREIALITLADKHNMKLEELEDKLADRREEREHKERIFASEAAITMRRPPTAPTGGGML